MATWRQENNTHTIQRPFLFVHVCRICYANREQTQKASILSLDAHGWTDKQFCSFLRFSNVVCDFQEEPPRLINAADSTKENQEMRYCEQWIFHLAGLTLGLDVNFTTLGKLRKWKQSISEFNTVQNRETASNISCQKTLGHLLWAIDSKHHFEILCQTLGYLFPSSRVGVGFRGGGGE